MTAIRSTLVFALLTAVHLQFVGAARADTDDAGRMYVGGSLGLAKSKDLCEGGPNSDGCQDTAVGGKAFVGYRANRFLGVELGLMRMTETSNSNTVITTGDVDGRPVTYSASTANEFVLEYSASLSALVHAPNVGDFAPFARAGVHAFSVSREKLLTAAVGGIETVTTTTRQYEDGVGPLLGAGVEYRLGERTRLRAEWEWILLDYKRWPDDEGHFLSLGLAFRF